MRRNLHLLTTTGFLPGLFLLLANDFLFKPLFNNWLTGKLSDFAGLFIFPLFLTAFAPKFKRAIYISTALAFTFWKSIYSEPLIDWWNALSAFKVARVADPTDLIALVVLPLSYIYFRQQERRPAHTNRFALSRLVTSGVVLLSLFAFTATSRANEHMVTDDRGYEFTMNKDELLQELRKVAGHVNHYRSNDGTVRRFEKINKRPMTEEERNNYSINTISKFCDSTVYASFTLHTLADKTVLKVAYLMYNCKMSGEQYDLEAVRTFEKDVIERLGGRPAERLPD